MMTLLAFSFSQKRLQPLTETYKLINLGDDKAKGRINSNFKISNFMHLTDSLLSKIRGKPIFLSYKTDTLTLSMYKNSSSFFKALFPSDKVLVKRFSFDPGKGYRELRFWLVFATYRDTIMANKAFNNLHQQTGSVDGVNDLLPGLTYTNDYVIKADKRIFWLNTGCIFGYSNHILIKEFLLKSLNTGIITDSIYCKCGQPVCK